MADQKKDRKLRQLTFRGKKLEELCEMKEENLFELFCSRQRRRLRRSKGFKGKYAKLVNKIKKSKLGLEPGQKSKVIRTHLRDTIVTPEMVGANVGIFNGKEFKEVEIKFDMIGQYLGEFSLTYKPTLRKANFGDKPKKKQQKGRK